MRKTLPRALVRQERGWRLRALLAGMNQKSVKRAAHKTDTELQAAARAIFRRLPVKILRQVLADVGLEAVVCVEKNDCMDALLALPPTKLAGIIEGSTAVGSAAEAAAAAATAAATGGGGSSSNDGRLLGSTEAAAAI